MKKSSVDSTLASTGSKVALFYALLINVMSTTLGILKVFGTIEVHGLPLNDWILSVEMLFIQVIAVFDKKKPGPVKDLSRTLVMPHSCLTTRTACSPRARSRWPIAPTGARPAQADHLRWAVGQPPEAGRQGRAAPASAEGCASARSRAR